jgi:hypothetical protein
VKSLLEIEEAIAQLPSDQRRQLVSDMPALCPEVFPADGWTGILSHDAPRPALTSLLDQLDAERGHDEARFPAMDENSLRTKK